MTHPTTTARSHASRCCRAASGSRAVRDPERAQRIADAVGRYAVVIAERTDVQPEQQA